MPTAGIFVLYYPMRQPQISKDQITVPSELHHTWSQLIEEVIGACLAFAIFLEIARWIWFPGSSFAWDFGDAAFLFVYFSLYVLFSHAYLATHFRFHRALWLPVRIGFKVLLIYFVLRLNSYNPSRWEVISVAVDLAPAAITIELIFLSLFGIAALSFLVTVEASAHRLCAHGFIRYDNASSFFSRLRTRTDRVSITILSASLALAHWPVAFALPSYEQLRVSNLVSHAVAIMESNGVPVTWASIMAALLTIGSLLQIFMAGVQFYDRFINRANSADTC